jgi:hypothetical protein
MHPGVEAVGIAQAGQVPPGPDEGVLDGVLRPVGISKDETCGRVQSIDRGACERGESVMIAPLCSFHEVSLHDATGSGATGRSRYQYGGGAGPNRSRDLSAA